MGAWYTIGLLLGVGVGAGVLAAGLLARGIPGVVVAAVGGALTGALVGLVVGDTAEVVAGVIGGLTPAMLEAAVERGSAPTLARLMELGRYRQAVSVFPSLTPVCLSSIATGAFPDVHEIPHLVWYRRSEERLVEYGSSFHAVRAAGIGRTLRDTLLNMNAQHPRRPAVTMFEALEDAGLVTAPVN